VIKRSCLRGSEARIEAVPGDRTVALRTETTISNTYDFGRRLCNLPELRHRLAANRRLIEVERLSHDCVLAEHTFQAINNPVACGLVRPLPTKRFPRAPPPTSCAACACTA
jgi:hypothetical protein